MAKVLGVLASVGGASIITLYKGPTIYAPHLALHQGQIFLSAFEDANGKNLNLGGILLFGHCLCWSGWIVMQAFVLKKYSAQVTVSAFTCFFGIVQFGTIAAFLEKDPKAWQLNSIEEAYSILYSVCKSNLIAQSAFSLACSSLHVSIFIDNLSVVSCSICRELIIFIYHFLSNNMKPK